MRLSERSCAGSLSRRQAVALLAALGVSADAIAQDASKANPRSYRVVLENNSVRVIEYKSRPGLGVCGEGMHSHPAHLTVVLSDWKGRATDADGSVVARDKKLGDVFWSEAETHKVENTGRTNSRVLIIELKEAHKA